MAWRGAQRRRSAFRDQVKCFKCARAAVRPAFVAGGIFRKRKKLSVFVGMAYAFAGKQ